MTALALATVATLGWAVGHGEQPGRHQRSRRGPVRGDGSGWTEEGVAMQLADDGRQLPGTFRGPEDDPDFLAQLNQTNRRRPPSEG